MNPKNSLKNHEALGFELKRPPTKAPRGGDIGRLIDCEIAEGFTLANLGHYPQISLTQWALPAGVYTRKIFKL